jgi:hypothetical protein
MYANVVVGADGGDAVALAATLAEGDASIAAVTTSDYANRLQVNLADDACLRGLTADRDGMPTNP